MRRVGVTLGDPCGIGPEIVLRALATWEPTDTELVIYGSEPLLRWTADRMKMSKAPFQDSRIKFVAAGPKKEAFPRDDRQSRAEAVLDSLDAAIDDACSGKIRAVVTAPIDKGVIRAVHADFTGHTEYLAERTRSSRPVMLLDNTEIRVVLVTQHIPLRDVPKAVTASELEETIRVSAKAFRENFGITKPRIAVAALNPHAGEIVSNPEEDSVFRPVIEKLRSDGWEIEGPFAADSLFPLARNGRWDFLVSPYHDQGLVAAKYPGLDKIVNITLGLPFLRISPGHGVAYDLVGTSRADPRSFLRALKVARSGDLKEKA